MVQWSTTKMLYSFSQIGPRQKEADILLSQRSHSIWTHTSHHWIQSNRNGGCWPSIEMESFWRACTKNLFTASGHLMHSNSILNLRYIYHKRNKHQFTNIRHEELFSIQRRLNILKNLANQIELVNELGKLAEDSNFLKKFKNTEYSRKAPWNFSNFTTFIKLR